MPSTYSLKYSRAVAVGKNIMLEHESLALVVCNYYWTLKCHRTVDSGRGGGLPKSGNVQPY